MKNKIVNGIAAAGISLAQIVGSAQTRVSHILARAVQNYVNTDNNGSRSVDLGKAGVRRPYQNSFDITLMIPPIEDQDLPYLTIPQTRF